MNLNETELKSLSRISMHLLENNLIPATAWIREAYTIAAANRRMMAVTKILSEIKGDL